MKHTTLAGLALGFFALIVGFIMEGGTVGALVQPTAMLIVFGGTIGATIASFSIDEIKTIPNLLRIAFSHKTSDEKQIIDQIIFLADKARREGLLYLENYFDQIEDSFLKKGIQLIVDGAEPELMKNILETEIYALEHRHKIGAEIFDVAGGYAPTMGIIGTVMGLVHVLGSITSPDALGPAIAVAFMATLYGVASANVVYFPIAAKLRLLSKRETLTKEMIVDGILSLQAGYNPILIHERLISFLDPNRRKGDSISQTDSEVVEE